MLTSSEITEHALETIRDRRDKKVMLLATFAVLDFMIMGWQFGVMMGLLAATTYFGSEYGTSLGRSWESSISARKRCSTLAAVAAILLVGICYVVVPTEKVEMRIFTGIALAIAIVSVANATVMASKFTHLTEEDVRQVNERDTRLLHPYW